MWQYKTILEAKITRYRDGDKVKGVPVPWALPNSRLSWLMEKNDRNITIYQKSNKDCTSAPPVLITQKSSHKTWANCSKLKVKAKVTSDTLNR